MAMIREAIVSGGLTPGTHLKESNLAAQMSVSRSPVREALRQLEQEGLVVIIPNQGCYVRDFDPEDIREIFTLRAALETLACEIVLEDGKLQSADLAQLEGLIEQQMRAIEKQDLTHLTELDMTFHEFVCSKAGFERLLKMWRSLRSQMEALFNRRFQAMPDYLPATVSIDHAAILDALRRRDMDELARLHREINTRVARECVRIIWSGAEEMDV
jgi:DNA-binding GntR family transcriptional regulator